MKNNKMKSEKHYPGNSKAIYPENYCVNSTFKTNSMNRSVASTGDRGKGIAIEHIGVLNIFLAQNKGKGPPGRQRSPGGIREHPPDVGITPDRVQNPVGGENPTNFKIQFFTNNKYNFLIHFLNFTKMKKQFLFLFLALFASVTVAFGQGAVHHTAPNPLTCGTADALHPIAGKPYDYGVGVSPTGGQYEWWATKATTFIQNGTVTHTTMLTAPGQLTAVGAGYGTPGATQTMSITWSSAILANTVFNTNPTFVAVGYSGATGSCADNLKVYQIDPRNGFTVDIFNIETATGNTLTTGTTSDCVSNIQSTTWNGTQMVYDYGTTTLTYEVVAANFTDFFTPAFRIAGLDAAEAATISWAYDQAFTNVGLTPTAITNGTVVTSTVTAAVGGTVTDTSNGVSIFVRVVVNHQAKEHTTAATIDLAVNAQNSVSQADVVNTDCTQTQYMEDVATRSLNPRPALTSMPVAPGFVPANTVP